LHWISHEDSVDCELRLYEVLFNVYDPNSLPNYLDGVNKNSLLIVKGAKMNKNLLNLKKENHVQFERLGYYVLDQDSDLENSKFVWNRTVSLSEKAKQKNLAKMNEK
jgi:glutaminyl-tRNA synthetase